MNIAALVQSFATASSYTVTRKTRGQTVRGRVQAGTTTTLTITASCSPTAKGGMLRLPEGRRETASMQIYTTTKLYPGTQGGTFEADVITIDGDDWEITFEDVWTDPISRTVGYSYQADVLP